MAPTNLSLLPNSLYDANISKGSRRVFWASGTSMACLAALGAGIYLSNGLNHRQTYDNQNMAELEKQVQNN